MGIFRGAYKGMICIMVLGVVLAVQGCKDESGAGTAVTGQKTGPNGTASGATGQGGMPKPSAPCPENNGKMLFSSELDPRGPANFDIYIAGPDGSAVTRLTDQPIWEGGPAWSQERCRIAFTASTDSKSKEDVYVMSADGSGRVRLTDAAANDREPDWAPDGEQIVFMSERDGNREIYVMNADGSDQRRLTDSPMQDEDPEWSPAGDEIVFSSLRDGNWEIYVMRPDGSGLIQLTNEKMQDTHPTWSPDGRQIAFLSNRSAYIEVYIMNKDGSGLRQVTSQGGGTPGVDIELSWSQDGSQLAFTCTVPGKEGGGIDAICAVGVDGSGLHVHVNRDPSRSHEADW